MNHFNLDQLRADAAQHFTDYQLSSMTSTQFDLVIDMMIEALIGDDHLDIMKTNRHAQIVFKPITPNCKYGQYLRTFHGLTN